MKKNYSNKGFTIMELMLSMGVLAALIAIAAPNLSEFLQRQRVNSQAEAISSALSVARSQALSQLSDVTVCWNPSSSAVTRKGHSIAAGNIAVLMGDTSTNIAGSQDVIADFAYGEDLFIADDEADNCVVFNDQGRLDLGQVSGNTLVMGVCIRSGENADSRSIVVGNTGRAVTNKNIVSGTPTINCS
jgi:type IV fimbrial biogenesis protein FimT